MSLTQMEIDRLEDVRVLVQARCLGPAGLHAARTYANSLMRRAMNHFNNKEVQEAVQLAAREFEFNSKMFGLQDPYTKASLKCLSALKKLRQAQPLNMERLELAAMSA